MKVFDNLDKQQAELYRWIRKKIDFRFFQRLTGLDTAERMSEVAIDGALLEACRRELAYDSAADVAHRSKIRSGIFPATLGMALEDFVEARIDAANFQESLGGLTYRDVDQEMKAKFLVLCEEMAKLR